MDPPYHKKKPKKQPPPPKKKTVCCYSWGGMGRAWRRGSRARHAITRAIMALLLLAKREPVREP